jgi:hypothetical protein
MRADAEQAGGQAVETISEGEFKRVCDGIYRDRFEIYEFNPGMGRRDVLLWMLLGCLISRLSIRDEEMQSFAGSAAHEAYGDIVRRLLSERGSPPFEPLPYLEALSNDLENE